jgi:hypothetical protein
VGLVVRLSPGAEPVAEIHASSLKELDSFLRSLSAEGVYSALKGAAREFADAPLAVAEAALAAMLPGAQVISEGDPSSPEPQADLATEAAAVKEWNRLAVERAVAKGQIPATSEKLPDADIEIAVDTTSPRCLTCGRATTEGSGTGAKGPWKARFCSSGDPSHTEVLLEAAVA